jgi:hypothetical protein
MSRSRKKKVATPTVKIPVDFGICQYCGKPGSDGFNGPFGNIRPSHFDCIRKTQPDIWRSDEAVADEELGALQGVGI